MGGGKSTTINNTATRISSMQIQSSAYGRCIPIIYGTNKIAGNIFWYDDFVATPHTTTTSSGGGGKGGGGSVSTTTTTYTYTASLMFGLSEGEIEGVGIVWKNKTKVTLDTLGLTLFTGSNSQMPWGFLSAKHPDKALAYRGTAYVCRADFDLGDNASLGNHTFEVKGLLIHDQDAIPSAILEDFLINDQYGLGFPVDKLGDLSLFNDYVIANGLFISPMYDEQQAGADHIKELLKMCNSSPVWSEGVLKIIPYGDSVVTGNGYTYTPDLTPIYDLNDSDFIDTDEPIKITRTSNADAYNNVKIEFLNRANEYNPEIVEVKDLANIDLYGLRPSDTITMHPITRLDVAKQVAQLLLQRALYIRNTYEFTVTWKYALLEPMDLVTLTDEALGLNKTPVRITTIEENEDATLKITAEDFPFGVSSATLYPSQKSNGTKIDYAIPAGNINTPVMFEPPLLLSNAYEIWIALSGGVNWGGAELWVSYDGNSYSYQTSVPEKTRTGYVTANWTSGNTLSVDLSESNGVLLSSSEALALVGNEVIKYSAVTLTGTNKYNLTVIERGLYKTQQVNHLIGERFTRLDASITKVPFTVDLIGRTIYYKALSFNVYGSARQALDEVSPFTFVIQGDLYPPSDVASFGYDLTVNGVQLKWGANSEIDVSNYEVREVNSGWGDQNYLWKGFATRTNIVQKVASKAYYIKAIDSLGNYSSNASMVTVAIDKPSTPSGLSSVFSVNSSSMATITISWGASNSVFGIDYYLVSFGTTSVKVNTTEYQTLADWLGNKDFSITAVDKMGFSSLPAVLSVTKLAPNAPSNFRAQVIDNNVLFYWNEPSITSLPVTSFELRRGDTWNTATVIGKKSGAFTTVFENVAGVYTYWIASIDADNRYSSPTNLTATVSQPPDFVLKASNTSNLSGTKNNALIDSDGSLLTLVNTTQTWSEHFTSRGWTSPQDQINAGYPLFIQPSTVTAYYEETVDLGTVLASSRVTINLSGKTVAGTVNNSCDISTSLDGVTWTTFSNVWQVYSTNFRYYKFKINFVATDDHGLYKVSGINSVLDVKLKNDAGSVTANASDVGGTTVNFNIQFVDVTSITVTPMGTTPLTAIYDFVDAPYPTSFKVLLFNQSGARVSGTVSWQVKGY